MDPSLAGKKVQSNSQSKIQKKIEKEAKEQIGSIYLTQRSRADFTIYCGKSKKPIRCHQIFIDARAPKLYVKIRERGVNEISFGDFEPEIVEPIIQFLYNFHIDIDMNNFEKMYDFADQLGLETVKEKIELKIQENLNKDNAFNYYLKLKTISLRDFDPVCAKLIYEDRENFGKKVPTLTQEELISLIELLGYSTEKTYEKSLIKMITIWLSKNEKSQEMQYKKQQQTMNPEIRISYGKLILDILDQVKDLKTISDSQIKELKRLSYFPMNVVMEFFENEKNTKIKENEKKITEMTTKLSGLEQQEEKLKTELEKIQNEIKNIKDDKKTMEKQKENSENNQDPQKGEENEVKKLLKGVRLNKENKDEKKEERDISISKILDSMESFPKTISIQKNGCFLLNFYSNQEDKIKEIGEKGIDRILTAIKESEKNNEIYDPGLEALVKIFTKNPNLDQKKRTELIDFCAKTLSPEEQNTTQVAILKLFEIFKVSKEEAGKLDLKNKVNEIQKQNDKDKDIKKLTKEILKNWD